MAIYRFSKWRPSAVLELFYHHTRPPTKSLLLAAAACQISCQCDTDLKILLFEFFAYLAWNAYSGPQNGGFGDFGPLNVIIHHRDPRKLKRRGFTQGCACKHPLRGLTCRRVDRKCDGHTQTDRHTQVNLYFCPCIELDWQKTPSIFIHKTNDNLISSTCLHTTDSHVMRKLITDIHNTMTNLKLNDCARRAQTSAKAFNTSWKWSGIRIKIGIRMSAGLLPKRCGFNTLPAFEKMQRDWYWFWDVCTGSTCSSKYTVVYITAIS